MHLHPSKLLEELTAERINEIGYILFKVRRENLDSAHRLDDGWTLGSKGFGWCKNELIEQSEKIPYLTIKNPSLKFIARMGNIDFSLYRGKSTKPKKNIYSRAETCPEIKQISLFGDIPVPEKIAWSYVIETDSDGEVTNIEFIGMSDVGEVISSHTVPIHQVSGAVVTPINIVDPEPVHIPPVEVELIEESLDDKVSNNHEHNKGISRR